MESEVLAKLFESFKNSYPEEEINKIWENHRDEFRRFWNERIMKADGEALSDQEIDVIIRILDSHGKGNTKNSEAVAAGMISQGTWRKMFNQFRSENKLAECVNSILTSGNTEDRTKRLNELYSINAANKNSLTGQSGSAINCLLAAYDPFENLSIVSLNDRIKLLKSLGIEYDNAQKSIGEQIEETTAFIKRKFEEANIKDNARTITTFAYKSALKDIWKTKDQNKAGDELKESDKLYETMSNTVATRKYWVYAPGENAKMWDEFYSQGVMGLGWLELGDLNNYKTKNEIELKLQKIGETDDSKRNDATANFEFKEVMSVGDVIIVKKGRKELLGYGEVISDYFFDGSKQHYQKFRKVKWMKKGNWKTDFSLPLKTLTDVTKYGTEHPDYQFYYQRLLGLMENESQRLNFSKFSLNTILYGPPGTGKTYKTIIKAAEIVEGREIEDYDEALDIFNKKLHDQIEFITFHQNYSYEDFVQGLRPDTENDKELTFQKKDGVFKILSERALKNIKESENPSTARLEFDTVFNKFMEPLSEGEEIEVNMKKTSFHITQISDKSIEFRKNKGDSQHTLSINTLRQMYNKGANDIILGGLQPYYNPILEILLDKGKTKQTSVSKKNYVLIIDEINRANISRVFGELITLIEPDKRSHGKTPIEVKLPSGDQFIVPSNLYIIGTMNTADKSIALLDIALRRRFVFEAMFPEYEIPGHEVFDTDVLKRINEQIIKTKGHDFQIGHAYFMDNPDNLVERMNQKVIPLLLEYYMNDEKEVKKILYGAGLELIENSWPIRISGNRD